MEDSRAGREDQTPEQAFMNSPGSQDAEKNPPAAFATHVNGEASLVRGRVYGWRRMAENTDAHCRFLAIGSELSAIRSFLRTRDERRFTNNGRGTTFCASCG